MRYKCQVYPKKYGQSMSNKKLARGFCKMLEKDFNMNGCMHARETWLINAKNKDLQLIFLLTTTRNEKKSLYPSSLYSPPGNLFSKIDYSWKSY